MKLKEILYTSVLSATIFSGCKGTLPGLQNPDVRAELEGTYKGKVDGLDMTYIVEKEKCISQYTLLEPFPGGVEIKNMVIEDSDCDKLFDTAPDRFGFVRDRKFFQKYLPEEVEKLDLISKKTQSLVKPENKVE